MVSCVNHPDREAVVKCRRCGRNFCSACVEKVGNYWYCFDCLKEIAREAKAVKHGRLTITLAVGALLSVLLGFVLLWTNQSVFMTLAMWMQSGSVQNEVAEGLLRVALPAAIGAFCYILLAVGMLANKAWAFPFGLLLNAFLLIWKAYEIMHGEIGSTHEIILLVGGPTAIILSLMMNRRLLVE